MKKPTKPSEELPKSFGGIKENFSDDKQATGYEPDIPDVLGGANLNYTLDTIGKKDTYHDTICDYINNTPINNMVTVDTNNELQYADMSKRTHYEDRPAVLPKTKDVLLVDKDGNALSPYVDYNKGQGYRLFDMKFSDHILTGVEATGWALCGTYTLTTDTAFYETCVAEKVAAGEAKQIEVENGYAFTGYVNANGHVYYDISEKANVDQIYNAIGSAWFYGIDTVNKRIFMPRNDNFTQNTGNVSKVGNFVEHGLPSHTHERGDMNITGDFEQDIGNREGVVANIKTLNASGAFSAKDEKGQAFVSTEAVTTEGTKETGISFDASKSWTGSTSEPDNTIYGNSETVQPRAVRQLCYICVGNVVINQEGIDVEKLEGDVRSFDSTKANIGLDNLSTDLTVGAGNTLLQLENGKFKQSTNTTGSGIQPVYLSNGAITASNVTVIAHAMDFKQPDFLKLDKAKYTIKAGTAIRLKNDKVVYYAEDYTKDITWSSEAHNGNDYYLFLHNDETITIETSKTERADAVLIGGGHTLCVGVTSAQTPALPANSWFTSHPASGYIAGDFIPNSSWTPAFLSDADSGCEGQVFVKKGSYEFWSDIYLMSGTYRATTSAYRNTITSNRQNQLMFMDLACVGKRSPNNQEFAILAEGSNQKTNIQNNKIPAANCGGFIDTAGDRMISAYFVEGACGVVWQIGRDIGPVGGTKAWQNYADTNRGGLYDTAYVLRLGGRYDDSTHCGSWSRNASPTLLDATVGYGSRGVSSHISRPYV